MTRVDYMAFSWTYTKKAPRGGKRNASGGDMYKDGLGRQHEQRMPQEATRTKNASGGDTNKEGLGRQLEQRWHCEATHMKKISAETS